MFARRGDVPEAPGSGHLSGRRHGISREAGWLQQTPDGDFTVVYLEADDVQAAFAGMGSSQDPFDVWFREHVRDVNGIDLEDGVPPPDQRMDYRHDDADSPVEVAASATAAVAGES
jgi:hypothetical protein